MLKIFCSTDLLLLVFLGLNSGEVSSEHLAFLFSRSKHATSAYSPSEWFYKFVLIECMLSGHNFLLSSR